jgi:hypothetical protein
MSKFMTSSNNFIFTNQVRNVNYNPFEEEIFKRDFKETIIIANLFEKVKKFIFNNF